MTEPTTPSPQRIKGNHMNSTKAQEIATLLATHEHVIRAAALGNRVVIDLPRERGGRSTMTLPEAKRLAERLGLA